VIQALVSWAAGRWHIWESRVALLTLSAPGGPVSPLDLSPQRYLAVLEGVVREDEARAERLDKLYNDAALARVKAAARESGPSAEDRAERRRQIQRLSAIFR
jgi:hypothetical protein